MTGAALWARGTSWSDGWIVTILAQAGIIGHDECERLGRVGGTSAWRACLVAGVATESTMLEAAGRYFHMPVASAADVAAASPLLLPGLVAMRLRVVGLEVRHRVLHVACADPLDLDLENAVAFAAGRRVRLHLASPVGIDAALARLYPSLCVKPTAEPGPAPTPMRAFRAFAPDREPICC